MEQLIIEQATNHPSIMAILTIIGVARVCMKPLMEILHKIVAATPSPKDDELLEEVEASKAWNYFTWVLDWLTSVKIGPQAIKKVVPLIMLGLILATSGCVSAINSNKITSIKSRGFGIVLSASSSTTATPEVKLGWFSTVFQMIPTSTNGIVYAPKYFDTLEITQSVNPFATGISENTGSGDVQISTNATGQAIIPKLKPANEVK